MLNRRYLRIKVYQALYAFFQSDGGSAARIEKELFVSIERTFDMYVSLMMLFGEVRHAAERRLEERRNKKLPTAHDLSADRRFVDDPVLVALAESPLLQAEAAKRRISWVGQGDLVQRLLKQFEASTEYQRLMEATTEKARGGQHILLHLFLDHIAQFEPLHDMFEQRSIYWLEDLDLACALVKRTISGLRDGEGAEEAMGDLVRDPAEEQQFVRTLFRAVIEQSESHEQAIAAKASNWESDRIALSDMILMKMALSEARTFEEIPVKVTLNEYIEIAKAYSTPKSKNFINGILDKLFAEMRENGTIRKVGRGLLES
ncbi:MAG: transcription antitermination protein NusB [Flavobacteriales bacterium]|nr:transcription antitermination protein NusB [Flavobacteriales bacterium]